MDVGDYKMVPFHNRYGVLDMPSMTIKNIPIELYERLKGTAGLHRRSINNEVLVCLERALAAPPQAPAALQAKARALRKLTKNFALTEKTLARAKNMGRP